MIFIFVILVSVLYLAASPYGENVIRVVLEDRLGEALGQRVSISSLETNIFSYVELRGSVLPVTTGEGDRPFLTVDHARVSYRLWRVFRHGFSADSVVIDSMRVAIIRDEKGLHIPGTGRKREGERTGQPLDFRLYFAQLEIKNSSLTYDDRIVPLQVSAGNVDIAIRERNDSISEFQVEAVTWNAAYREHALMIDSLAVTGRLTGNEVILDRFELDFPGLRCFLAGTVGIGDSPVAFNGEGKIEGSITPIASLFSDTFPSWLNPRSGMTITNIGFSGNIANPSLIVTTHITDMQLRDTVIPEVSLEGSYTDRVATISRMSLDLLDGSVVGEGKVVVDSLLMHDFSLTLNDLQLDRVWEMIYKDSSPYRGKFTGILTTGGPLRYPRDLTAAAHLSMEKMTYQSQKLDDFETDMIYEKGRFNLAFAQAGTVLNAGVSLDGEEVRGTFRFQTTKPGGLAGFARIFELNGNLDVAGTISGTIRNPSITADFDGRNIRFHGFPLDSAHGRVLFENGAVVLEESIFSGKLASVDSLTDPFHVTSLHGGVYYSGTIKGPVNDLEGRIELRLVNPEYRTYRLDSVEGLISVRDRKITVEHSLIKQDSLAVEMTGFLHLPSKSGSLTLVFSRQISDDAHRETIQTAPLKTADNGFPQREPSGTMNIGFSFADPDMIGLKVRGTALHSGQIADVYQDSLSIEGLLDFDLEFEGTPEKPSGRCDFFLDSPRFRQVEMDSLRSSLRVEPDKLIVDSLEMYLNNQKTSARGEIELKHSPKGYPAITGQSAMRWTAEGKNIIVQMVKLVLPPDMTVTGGSSYSLECSGTFGKPVIRGNFIISDAEFRIKPGAPPIQKLNISTSLQDTVLVIDRAEGSVSDIPFILTGLIATSDWKQFRTEGKILVSGIESFEGAGTFTTDYLDYHVSIKDFDIALLRPLTPGIHDLTGRAFATVSVSGSFQEPDINGSLHVSGVVFQIPYFNIPVSQGAASVQFGHKAARLDSLTALIDKGTIFASGNAAYSENTLTQLDLNAALSGVTFIRPKNFSLAVDTSRLTLTKRGNNYDLEGEIDLGESKLERDFQPRALLPFMEKVDRPSPSPSPFLQYVRMNVMIRGGRKLWVDNNLARLRISSDIGMIGTLARPNVTGRLSVEEGYILYVDRKFIIKRGIMDFIDPNRLNPLIDLSAETSLKSYQTLSATPYEITLTVNGSLDQAAFELTSQPPLDKPDIIALLTVGATRQQLTGQTADGTDTSLKGIIMERAEMLSSQKISGYVSRKFGNLLGLKEVSIEGNLFNVSKSSGPQLIASEQISDRMDITYSTAVGHMNEQKVRLDYRLNTYISIMGETDQKGRSGLDLKYRLRFK